MEIKDLAPFLSTPDVERKGPTKIPGGEGDKSFAGVLGESIDEVNRLQKKADEAITQLATGEKASLHETMIAMEQAAVSFQLMMEVRNKIVEAYQEVVRMQV